MNSDKDRIEQLEQQVESLNQQVERLTDLVQSLESRPLVFIDRSQTISHCTFKDHAIVNQIACETIHLQRLPGLPASWPSEGIEPAGGERTGCY